MLPLLLRTLRTFGGYRHLRCCGVRPSVVASVHLIVTGMGGWATRSEGVRRVLVAVCAIVRPCGTYAARLRSARLCSSSVLRGFALPVVGFGLRIGRGSSLRANAI
jgi:hypothetical protein